MMAIESESVLEGAKESSIIESESASKSEKALKVIACPIHN